MRWDAPPTDPIEDIRRGMACAEQRARDDAQAERWEHTREALDVIVYQSMMRRCAAVVAPRRKSANPPASSSA